jgi:quercetin dioxygenase-like cupin family protein
MPSVQPHASTRDDAHFRFLGVPTLMRSTGETTNGAFGLMEHWDMPPGFGTPYHVHRSEDEAFYVLEGRLAVVCDGNWMELGPGGYAFGPRGIPHGFKVVGDSPLRMLILWSPAGFERFVLSLAEDPATLPAEPDMGLLIAKAAENQIEILGPLPDA